MTLYTVTIRDEFSSLSGDVVDVTEKYTALKSSADALRDNMAVQQLPVLSYYKRAFISGKTAPTVKAERLIYAIVVLSLLSLWCTAPDSPHPDYPQTS